jgi:hypothetical protein
MSQMKLHPDSTRIHPSFSYTSSSSGGGGKQTMHHLIVASRFCARWKLWKSGLRAFVFLQFLLVIKSTVLINPI